MYDSTTCTMYEKEVEGTTVETFLIFQTRKDEFTPGQCAPGQCLNMQGTIPTSMATCSRIQCVQQQKNSGTYYTMSFEA
eukprot:6039596-Amphidinium_carterae.2